MSLALLVYLTVVLVALAAWWVGDNAQWNNSYSEQCKPQAYNGTPEQLIALNKATAKLQKSKVRAKWVTAGCW